MIPNPVALGLTLCDYLIVEERTKKVSLIGTFTTILGSQFPAAAQPFSVFAVLTDGLGDAAVSLVVKYLATDQEVYSYQNTVQFPDRLFQLQLHIRINALVWPYAGWYDCLLMIDNQFITNRRIRVKDPENVL